MRFKQFGANLKRGLGVIGKGALRLTKGALGVIGNPVTAQIARAINPALGTAATAVGAIATGAKRGIEALEARNPQGAVDEAKNLYASRKRLRTDITDSVNNFRANPRFG
jgi:hypothetical protein